MLWTHHSPVGISSSHVTSNQSSTLSWHAHNLWTLHNSVQQRVNFLTKPSYKSHIINSQNWKSICNFASVCFQHSLTSCMWMGQKTLVILNLDFTKTQFPKGGLCTCRFLWLCLHWRYGCSTDTKISQIFYFQRSFTTPIL